MSRPPRSSPSTGHRLLPALVLALAALPCSAGARSTVPDAGGLFVAEAGERLAWAYRLEHGEGVAKQPELAIRLFCTLAWEGKAEAAYELGWIYLNGREVPKDEGRGMAWISSAAEQGDPLAVRLRGQLSHVEPTQTDCAVPDDRGGWVSWAPKDAKRKGPVAGLALSMAPRFGLDPRLVLALIEVESDFDPAAVSTKGAQGLMQLMPATSSRFSVEDPFDPKQNLAGGMAYLSWLLTQFDGDLTKALAGYNAGEGAVTRHGGIPPYPETETYVREVMKRYRGPETPL